MFWLGWFLFSGLSELLIVLHACTSILRCLWTELATLTPPPLPDSQLAAVCRAPPPRSVMMYTTDTGQLRSSD